MKRFLKFGLVAMLSMVLFSCDWNDDDGYSLDKFWVGFGVIHVNDDAGFTIKMDDGSELFPVDGYYHWDEEDDSTRVLVNFTVLGDKRVDDEVEEYYVRINSIRDILFKGILDITEEIEDSIGNDPIHVESVWTTNNMLTFELDYYGNGMIHYVNLVKEPGEITADNQPVALELRHNDRDDAPNFRMSAFVTFDLSSLQIEGQDSVAFKVTGKDYEGEVFEYEGTYRY
ncbi:NigD-like protein [uncultured Sunxiuqinia sp.]|uniref:NigD-like protein n=1 Tax=uncultured Sunxiuqinia sp. TaxID=1573825 RepID=UPI00261C9EF5|nr:NigD-like protein [uncultured Sunxiuqinia sp.]